MEKTTIKDLYEDPKSRNFINHLIKSYLPIHKTTKVFEFEDKNKHKCSICGHDLIDVETILQKMYSSEDYMKDSLDEMRKVICDGEKIEREDRAIIKHVTHGAVLAWRGEKTTTYLCQDCIQELIIFFQSGVLSGDKNLIWLVNHMRRNEVFSNFRESPSLDPEEKNEVKSIEKRAEKKKCTLGDLEVLQNLKAKMEAEEKIK